MSTRTCEISATKRPSRSRRSRHLKHAASALLVVGMLPLLGCDGGTASNDSHIRLTAVERTSDQAELARVAIEDTDHDVRLAAAKKLTDPAALGKTATEASDCYVRVSALKKITDQSLLAKVAIRDKDEFVRAAAVENLTDPAELARVVSESSGPKDGCTHSVYARDEALKKITDQALLAKVAESDEDTHTRSAALMNLTDPAGLARVALCDSWIASDAYGKLEKSGWLAKSPPAADATTRVRWCILTKIPAARKPLPDEHRDRLCMELLRMLGLLANPLVSEELGAVKDMRVEWNPCSTTYTVTETTSSGTSTQDFSPRGEQFSVSVNLGNESQTISQRWTTEFPSSFAQTTRETPFGKLTTNDGGILSGATTSNSFWEARVEPGDFAEATLCSPFRENAGQACHRGRQVVSPQSRSGEAGQPANPRQGGDGRQAAVCASRRNCEAGGPRGSGEDRGGGRRRREPGTPEAFQASAS